MALRLNGRNRMALVYGYLFPLIFLLSFLALYRVEHPQLIRHMGELLTVTILGGACFGLPTTLVSERERGVWRRYRLAPVGIGTLVTGTLVARYVIVLTAVVMQLGLAMMIGRWVPAHPASLWFTCSIVMFALLGMGLVIAALADTVPAVQALGQCLFLPMLIVGGVAVRLETMPAWVLPVSAFLPGRYAVEAIQSCVNGEGLTAMTFPLSALFVMGSAGCLAGAKLFRWDARTRFSSVPGKSWLIVPAVAWSVVGGLAVAQHRLLSSRMDVTSHLAMTSSSPPSSSAQVAAVDPAPARASADPEPGGTVGRDPSTSQDQRAAAPPAVTSTDIPSAAPSAVRPSQPNPVEDWRSLTAFDFAALPIAQMPPDDGNVSPIAADDEAPAGSSAQLLKTVVDRLPAWAPGHVANPVQRVRNYLLLIGVADFAQSSIERFLPGVVVAQMLKEFPPAQLAQLLCWVALHSDEGDISALGDPLLVDLGATTLDPVEVRTRTYYYGVKLTRRVIGW